jgi:hypothetical protein
LPRPRVAVCFGLAAATSLAILSGAFAAPSRPIGSATPSPVAADDLTFSAVRSYDNACSCWRLRFSGAIPVRKARQYVAVVRRPCGTSLGSSVAGTQTRRDGRWQVTIETTAPAKDSGSYRARWKRLTSRRVVVRGQLEVTVSAAGFRSYRIGVRIPQDLLLKGAAQQDMQGRRVLVQRQLPTGWKAIGSARLAAEPAFPGGYFAAFTAPQSGWHLRAVVSAAGAAPCFRASASAKWIS